MSDMCSKCQAEVQCTSAEPALVTCKLCLLALLLGVHDQMWAVGHCHPATDDQSLKIQPRIGDGFHQIQAAICVIQHAQPVITDLFFRSS